MAEPAKPMPKTAEAIGVDLGGTNIRVARVAADGSIRQRISAQVPKGAEAQIDSICAGIRQVMSEETQGVGIGVAGRVRVADGIVLTAGYLDLRDVSLRDAIEDQIGKPVIVDNDAHMAAFAEIKVGAAVDTRDVVMFTIGTGIGGAIVLDGELYYGGGVAGQLGHIAVALEGRLCQCGRRGCVETLSSGTALRAYIDASSLPGSVMVEELLEMDNAGNREAGRVLTEWVTPLRMAIDSMVAILDPEVVLLGGGLGEAAFRALSHAPAISPWYQCSIKPAHLGDNAGVIGAALRVLSSTEGLGR